MTPQLDHGASFDISGDMMRVLSFLMFILLCAGALNAAQPPANLQIELAPARVSMTGVTPGGKVIVFAVTLQSERGMQTLRRFEQVMVDDDRNGIVVLDPNGGVPLRSIWTAVDLASGAKAIRVPAGFDLNDRQIDAREFRKDPAGVLDAFFQEALSLDFLLVRPGAGAWQLRAREGGSRDGDRARDGKLSVVFEDAQPMDTDFGKAPKHLKAGDVLIAIDPGRLELMTATISK
ncbi:MAG: hypothetical protein ACTHQM_11755 [Thermoanaerobaculia bacterium]